MKTFEWPLHKAEITKAYASMRASRDRAAVYPFLIAIYKAARRLQKRSRSEDHAFKVCRALFPDNERKPVIRTFIDAVSTDSAALRSKWYRALRYCFSENVSHTDLHGFMEQHGGINGCADEWAKARRRQKEAL